MLRRLAADRSARAPGRTRQAVPLQCRTSVLDLQRTTAASVSRIHLRLACRLEPATQLDAPRSSGHDPACREFFLARPAGRCRRSRWNASEAKGLGLAHAVQLGKETPADLSNRSGVVCV